MTMEGGDARGEGLVGWVLERFRMLDEDMYKDGQYNRYRVALPCHVRPRISTWEYVHVVIAAV
jgi:hypothetical protein